MLSTGQELTSGPVKRPQHPQRFLLKHAKTARIHSGTSARQLSQVGRHDRHPPPAGTAGFSSTHFGRVKLPLGIGNKLAILTGQFAETSAHDGRGLLGPSFIRDKSIGSNFANIFRRDASSVPVMTTCQGTRRTRCPPSRFPGGAFGPLRLHGSEPIRRALRAAKINPWCQVHRHAFWHAIQAALPQLAGGNRIRSRGGIILPDDQSRMTDRRIHSIDLHWESA